MDLKKRWDDARQAGRVPRDLATGQAAAEIRRKWKERAKRKKGVAKQSLLERYAAKLDQQKIKNLLDTIPPIEYSMGGTRRVDITHRGETHQLMAEYTHKTYCGNYKGRETYGRHALEMTPSEIKYAKTIAGVLTVAKKYSKSYRTCYKCRWVNWDYEGRTKNLTPTWADGYLCGESHAPTAAEARRLESKKRAEKSAQLRRQRLAAVVKKIYALEYAAKLQQHSRHVITVDDSVAAGNCRGGTIAWARNHGINDQKIQLGTLAEIAAGDYRAMAVVSRTLNRLPLLPARLADVR